MKKITLSILCIISIFWFMPIFVKAYTPEVQYVLDWLDDKGSVYNETWVNSLETTWINNRQLLVYAYGVPNYREAFISNDGHPFSVSGNDVTMYDRYAAYNSNAFNSVLYNTRTLTDGGDNGLIKYFGSRSDVQNLLIDYETLYYSPLIPKVDFSVVLDSPSTVGSVSSEQNLFNVNINSDVGTDYYIQIGYKTHIPYKILVGVNSNGSPYYTNQLYGNSVSIENIYSLEDNQVAFSGNLNSDLFTWDRVAITDSNFEFIDSLAGQTEFKTNAKNLYNNRMSYLMPLYGKKIEIFMRYFVIQDGVVIVGQWTHWNNTYPNQYTENLPDNYIVYHAIPGYQQNSDNVNLEDGENTIQNVGVPTGNTGNNIVINNNVPNYPDYPTVADYNRDNLLVGFINTAKSMPQYLGEFNDFLKLAFSFIDPSVWAVISLGFGASIVIMIIKVL